MKRLVLISAVLALAPLEAARAWPHRDAPPPVAPACTPQIEPNAGGPEAISGFGCATLSNLRAMVADPHDLQVGRDLTPAHGDAALMPIRRYTADNLKVVPPRGSSELPSLVVKEQNGK